MNGGKIRNLHLVKKKKTDSSELKFILIKFHVSMLQKYVNQHIN